MRQRVCVAAILTAAFAIPAMSGAKEPGQKSSVPPSAKGSQKIGNDQYRELMKPLDLYAPPPKFKKLLTIAELHRLVATRGASLKVSRETYNAAKQSSVTEDDKKKPVLALSLSHDQKWTKTMVDSDPLDAVSDRKSVIGSRSIGSSAGLNLTGSPAQGVSYKLSFPQLAYSGQIPNASSQNPRRPDSASFNASLEVSLLRDNPMLVEPLARKKSTLALTSARESLKLDTINKIKEAESGFYALAQKYLQLSVQERSLKLAIALENEVREKIAAGESGQLEAVSAELQKAQSETDFMSAQIEYEAAVEEFRRSLSYDEKEGDGIFPDPKALDIRVDDYKVPVTASEDLKKFNSEIVLSKLSRQVAEIDLNLARKASLPGLGFSTSYGNATVGNGWPATASDALKPNDRTYSVALNYSHVLFNDTSKNALQASLVAKQKADFFVDETERKVMKEFNSLIKKLEIGSRRFSIAKISREIAEKKLNSEYEKFRVGESSVRNVIETQTALNGARISEISAKLEVVSGFAQLNGMIGRLPDGVVLPTQK